MKLMQNVMEFDLVEKNGTRSKRTVDVKALSLAVSLTPPKTRRKSRFLLTSEDVIEVEEARTCGEAEYVAIMDKGDILMTAGSDHLDLTLSAKSFERVGMARNPAKEKQLCPGVVAKELWRYSDVKDHWSALRLKSSVTIEGRRTLFQDFPISQIVDLETHLSANPKLREGGTVLFSGSANQLPSAPPNLYNVDLAEGGIFPRDFHFELMDPVLGRTISHGYSVQVLE